MVPMPDGATLPALRLESLSLGFGEQTVLEQVSLAIPQGAIAAVIGPSGVGKSSLLRACNRLLELEPSAWVRGRVELFGEDIHAPGHDPVELRRRVGMIYERPALFDQSLFENLAYGLRRQSYRGSLEAQVERSLRQVGLWESLRDRLGQPVDGLDEGVRQRLCIARAIATEPELLLLDNPCASLDEPSTLALEELLLNLQSRLTILLVTQDLKQAARCSDLTVFLDRSFDAQGRARGVLAEMGPTAQLFQQPQQSATLNFLNGRRG